MGKHYTVEVPSRDSIPTWKVVLLASIPIGGLGFLAYWYFSKPKDTTNPPPTTQKAVSSKSRQTNANKLRLHGNECFKSSNYKESVEYYTKAIEACEKHDIDELSIIYQNRAAAYEKLSELESAIRDSTEALKIKPEYVKALLRRGKLQLQLKQHIKGLVDLMHVCMIEEKKSPQGNNTITPHQQAYKTSLDEYCLEKALETIRQHHPLLVDQYTLQMLKLEFVKDPLFLFDVTTDSSVTNGDGDKVDQVVALIRRLQSGSDDLQKLPPDCSSLFEKLSSEKNHPHIALLYLLSGSLRMVQRLYDDALSCFDELLKLDSVDDEMRINALLKQSKIYLALSNKSKAEQCINEAVKLNEAHVDVLFHRAVFLMMNEDIQGGLQALTKTVDAYPRHAVARNKLVVLSHLSGLSVGLSNEAQFEAEVSKLWKDFPDVTENIILHSQQLAESKSPVIATEFLEARLAEQPDNPIILVHLSLMALRAEPPDVEKSLALANRAVGVDPTCQSAYEVLGSIHLQRAQQPASLLDGAAGAQKRVADEALGLKLLDKSLQCCRTVPEMEKLLQITTNIVVRKEIVDKEKPPLDLTPD